MKIDRNNYELFIVDYIEGKFNSSENKIMQQFISENPDIAEEIKIFRQNIVTIEPTIPIYKLNLYKSFLNVTCINDINFEEFCVAFLENDLDDNSKNSLLKYISDNPEKRIIFEFYQKLRLAPDISVKYSNSRKLKKQAIPVFKTKMYITAIAATILILIMFRNIQHSSVQKPINNENTKVITENRNIDIKTFGESKNIADNKILRKNISVHIPSEVFDTNHPYILEKVRIAELNPRVIIIENNQLQEKLISSVNSEIDNLPANIEPKELQQEQQSEKTIIPFRESIFVRALQLGVKGISNMTESDMVLNTQLDENGNLAEIGISAGGFEISRKLSSNAQKN